MENKNNSSKYTQNYPTERKDYDTKDRQPSEGGRKDIEEAIDKQTHEQDDVVKERREKGHHQKPKAA